MVDITADRAIRSDMQALVGGLSRRWPEETMRPVLSDMEYGQHAEALLNIIAIGHKSGLELNDTESRKITDLVGRMNLQDDVRSLADYLRSGAGDERASESAVASSR